MRLEAIDIRIVRGRRAVVDGVDLAVTGGEVVGLVGPNGAGKSSLLKVMAGVAAADGGDCLLDGASLARLGAPERARAIGYLAQQPEIHWPLAVTRVVEMGRFGHRGRWRRLNDDDRAAVAQAMALTEVEALGERTITTLSGGERMRVLLARLFAAGTPILLADEPTAALDPYHQLHVMELMRWHADRGGAVIAVLHDLNMAARFCDRIVLLHRGRVHGVGSPAEVLTEAALRDVYGVDVCISEAQGQLSLLPWRRARGHQ